MDILITPGGGTKQPMLGEPYEYPVLANDVSDTLIMELGTVDQDTLDAVKKSIEAELREKQRLAEEEAARKKAEAAGPALEDIAPEEMLDHIESIRICN